MPTATASGTTVPYLRQGSGLGLLLLHGTNSDGATGFGPVIDRFTDQRTVLAPDYAGSGGSTVPDGPLDLDLLTTQAAAVITDAATGPVDVVGVSLGAVVAAATAAAHPHLVRRLVLVAGWVSSDDPRHRLVFQTWRTLEASDPALATAFGLSLALSPGFLAGLGHERVAQFIQRRSPDGTAARIELGQRVDLRNRLPQISAPTLVIGLTQDNLVPAAHARAMHQAIPHSRYTEIDSGHAVVLEQPDQFVRHVRDFVLDEPDPTATRR
ncbi:alpha/beta fold hydrolase [Kitasatospora viridis]|uniref:Pimeloyl-ACP methyl ester carboxylesterase n=1 Tax=Kitasatospora viridis TaxID=281105 RepID=A0A561TWR9_9ACTN|nr:alpha/beta hydrolase [Kitasatospora viridis]TWF91561.1 pimeloyl-ACP methyl ester carboxylesterase [Kitasatospora viridis]